MEHAIEIKRTSFKTIELINIIHWLVVWKCLEHILGIHGISSSQLTNSIIFQRGRYTTNQILKGTNCFRFDGKHIFFNVFSTLKSAPK
jgi:hypothetical protein